MKNTVTEKLITAIQKQTKPAPDKQEIAFLRDFYHRLSGQDFAVDQALELSAAALRHRALGKIRAPGKTLIDVYNLTREYKKTDHQHDPQAVTLINIITDDKPFIIDSLTIKLNAMRKTPHRSAHPSFEVQRDTQHRMISMSRFKGSQTEHGERGVIESYIQFAVEFAPLSEHKSMQQELQKVMADIEIVVNDWTTMRRKALWLAERVEAYDKQTVAGEHGALLRWLENHNFAFLGYAELDIMTTATAQKTVLDEESVLGILRAANRREPNAAINILPPMVYEHTSSLVVTKTRQRSTIHRANYLDCIIIDHASNNDAADKNKTNHKHDHEHDHEHDHKHNTRRVSCILGFLAGSSSLLPTAAIPLLRNKTDYILTESTLRPGGYAYKSLQATLETLPREKLFQMDTRSLYKLCMTVLNHLERRKARVHLHRDICGHFYSCLVYIPRELFNSTLRQRIQQFLQTQLDAEEVTFNVYFSDSILTRIHYLAHCRDRSQLKVDATQLESAIQAMARDWNDNLHETIRQQSGYEHANQIMELYRDAFPRGYQDEFPVEQAHIDINRLGTVGHGKIHAELTARTRRNFNQNEHTASFKLYCDDKSIALSDVLPILENMGIRVLGGRPYRFRRCDGATLWLHDFEIVRQDNHEFDIAANAENFQTTFTQAWCGKIENDGFNQLTLLAGLNWREVNLLRAYYRYLKQIRLRYSEQYIIDTLANNPQLMISITAFFNALFNPTAQGKQSNATARRLKSAIHRQLEQVATLDEDRIIRALLDVISATLRTNYYQTTADGEAKSYLALKLSACNIPRIPEPAPKYEIFVCSPRVAGVHLRGGDVARGGLRWSERPEDFRTEVLGLVKAQRVKNAVIVPMGSKGGFVAKQLPEAGRDEIQQEVIACYRLFISGLLDITDNLSGNKIIPPRDVVRMDGDDPYLVVAADKGTATFSDIANELSNEYGFWLGDAFASGGSVGYDHKKMGITARGAWESVKRHFRELGKDIQTTDFSVVGIGDMAGDVFGNGMLLSKHIRLVAAFNHMHIFIDPSPDSTRSYRERRRLFDLPRSSWSDYNHTLISTGGGVFERSAKSITLSAHAKKALGASKNKYTPDELINLILKVEVELLWNGGIGTYIKASFESDAAAQDKNNDGLRVSANQLRCKVLGEGGNLGITQLARVEYAQGGGMCYTDAIDNSAGVDTSDHEVNIKILLNAAIQHKLLPPKQRNALLAKMEDEIGLLVLQNNYAQTQTISIECANGKRRMSRQCRAIDALEEKGLLNREIEFLPNNRALEERREEQKWLTRPELSVLLSYSKMDLYQALLDSDLPDDPYLAVELARYFPAVLSKKYPKLVRAHRLAREIICTQITNHLVGTMGPTFHLRLAELAGSEPPIITRAYLIARDLLGISAINAAIESLDNRVDTSVQMEMLNQTAATMQQCIAWLLRNQPGPLDIQYLVSTFAPGCKQLKAMLTKTLGSDGKASMARRSKKLNAHGVPSALAEQIAALPFLGNAVDIVSLAARSKRPLAHAAAIYFSVRETLDLDWVEQAIDSLPASNDWHERARFSLGNDLRASHTAIADKMLSGRGVGRGAARKVASKTALMENWLSANRQSIQNLEKMIAALKAEHTPDFAMLSVLISELAWLH